MILDPSDLDARDTLVLLETGVRRRRAAEMEDLVLCLHWADLHAADPRDNADRLPGARVPGGERLAGIGGDGTPGVRELSICELAIARGVHTNSARAVVADALDLRHRMPLTWEVLLGLEGEPWVGRKAASMSRHLPVEVMHVVDTAVAAAIAGQSPARVIDLVAAKIIEADTVSHEERLAAERHRRYVALGRADDTGLRTVIARVTVGDAHWVDATVGRVAEILSGDPAHDGATADELRAIAFGLLARPSELAALLDGSEHEAARTLRPRAVLYVHLHEAALVGFPGVARVEGLGPQTLSALQDLLGRTDLVVKPVIDLHDHVSTSAYEHPEAIKERIHLRSPGDQFPHGTRMTRTLDLDHTTPFDPHGPPGQTSASTSQPLVRTGHRAKTHLGYRSIRLPTGEVFWRTPHGLHRLVDASGTHALTR